VIDPPVWCGAALTAMCGGHGDLQFFVEKLLSGKRDQGDRELGVSLDGLAFVASQGVPERDLVAKKQYS